MFNNKLFYNLCGINSILHGFLFLLKANPYIEVNLNQPFREFLQGLMIANSDDSRNSLYGEYVKNFGIPSIVGCSFKMELYEIFELIAPLYSLKWNCCESDKKTQSIFVKLNKIDEIAGLQDFVQDKLNAKSCKQCNKKSFPVLNEIISIETSVPNPTKLGIQNIPKFITLNSSKNFELKFVVNFDNELKHFTVFIKHPLYNEFIKIDDLKCKQEKIKNNRQIYPVMVIYSTK